MCGRILCDKVSQAEPLPEFLDDEELFRRLGGPPSFVAIVAVSMELVLVTDWLYSRMGPTRAISFFALAQMSCLCILALKAAFFNLKSVASPLERQLIDIYSGSWTRKLSSYDGRISLGNTHRWPLSRFITKKKACVCCR
jgi:hypothetical protein